MRDLLLDDQHEPGEHLVAMPARVRDSVHLNRARAAALRKRNPEPDRPR